MSSGTGINLATPAGGAVIQPPVAPPAPAPTPNLRQRAYRGSVWTAFEYGFNQAFRFGSNLILVHLLMPEVFGLMMVVTGVLTGLQMFSDVGIGPSIIQTRRGDDPAYLNTAWTIQVIRGFVLWLVACALAYPASLLWYPELLYLLPVASLSAVISGFNATSLFVLNRQLRLGRISMLQMSTQIAGVLIMTTWAYFDRTVWALVAGTLLASLVRMILSHFLAPGPTNRFRWERQAARELFHFGRWITVSTMLTFFAQWIDKLMFTGMVPAAIGGVYYQGYNVASLLPNLSKQLGGKVGFPALSDLYRRDVARFKSRLLHLRFMLIVPINLGLLLLVMLAPLLFHLIYPPRYLLAGWIVQVLAINSLAGMVNTSYGHAILASGRTFLSMIAVGAMLVVMIVAPLVGYTLDGGTGFIMGVGVGQWLLYPVNMLLAKKCDCWQPRFDLPVLIGFAAAAVGSLLASNGLIHYWFI